MITAECTWGEGPDVLICIKQPLWLMQEPVNKEGSRFPTVKGLITTTHGFSLDSQLDLTKSEALELAANLIKAAYKCHECESDLDKLNQELSCESSLPDRETSQNSSM